MNFVIKTRHLFLIVLIFLTILQESALLVGNFTIPYYFFVIALFIGYVLIKHYHLITKNIKRLYKTKTGKYLAFFILWIFVGIFVSMFTGNFLPKSFLSNFIGNFFCSNLFPFLIPALIIPFCISYKKLCKYLLILYFIIFALGIIEYIGNTYSISFIQNIFLTIVNRISTKMDIARVFSEAYDRFRISGIFQEPGGFAAFIFISSPIVYFLCTSKMRLLKIRVLDISVKISTFILMTICFIGTQSPINLCFMLIFLGCVILKKIIDMKIKSKGIILFSLFCTIVLASVITLNVLSLRNIDVTDTYLSRIVTVSETFTSMSKLVEAEPSLATRVGNYSAEFIIGMKNPVFGVGYGNINAKWAGTVKNLPFPVTRELTIYAYLQGTQSGGASMLFKLIAETGFVGTALFYMFLFSIILTANKIKKYHFGFQNGLLNSFQIALILYICVSFYIFLQPIMWVYFGILEAIVLNTKVITVPKQITENKTEEQ